MIYSYANRHHSWLLSFKADDDVYITGHYRKPHPSLVEWWELGFTWASPSFTSTLKEIMS